MVLELPQGCCVQPENQLCASLRQLDSGFVGLFWYFAWKMSGSSPQERTTTQSYFIPHCKISQIKSPWVSCILVQHQEERVAQNWFLWALRSTQNSKTPPPPRVQRSQIVWGPRAALGQLKVFFLRLSLWLNLSLLKTFLKTTSICIPGKKERERKKLDYPCL